MKKLEENIILFYLEPRLGNSGETHKELEKNLNKKKKETLNIMLNRRNNVMKTREVLLKGDIKKFAELLNEEHKQKETLNSKTTTEKSKIFYDAAMKNGAIAGKISGAGQGGCAFFICKKENQERVIKKLSSMGAVYLPLKMQRLNHMGEI